eukprot:m.212810 g.212810  ORF g.212810 m.212810 type:complete len:112 (-) comp17170_c0_seq3:105-440(-)
MLLLQRSSVRNNEALFNKIKDGHYEFTVPELDQLIGIAVWIAGTVTDSLQLRSPLPGLAIVGADPDNIKVLRNVHSQDVAILMWTNRGLCNVAFSPVIDCPLLSLLSSLYR